MTAKGKGTGESILKGSFAAFEAWDVIVSSV